MSSPHKRPIASVRMLRLLFISPLLARKRCLSQCTNPCPHGHKTDQEGCPDARCECKDPCEGLTCPHPLYICQLTEPECADGPPNCVSTPKCKKQRRDLLKNQVFRHDQPMSARQTALAAFRRSGYLRRSWSMSSGLLVPFDWLPWQRILL